MCAKRRDVLRGLCAGTAEVLFARRLLISEPAVDAFRRDTAPAGMLDLMISALSPGTLRISIAPANQPVQLHELGVVARREAQTLIPSGQARAHDLAWGKYHIDVNGNPLRVSVREAGKPRQEIRFDLDSTNVRFNLDGPVFGLGEGVQPFDRRGTRDAMLNGQHEPDLRTFGSRVPIPWVMSPTGWGVFIGQPQGSIAFTETEATFFGAEATSTRNVYLLLGDSPVEVLREYAGLTGFPHLPPLWAFGYQQSHRTLASRDEILSVARTFRDKKLPCDAVIYLGTGFCPSGWNTGHGSFTFNEKIFPHPRAVIGQLHDDHLKVIVHVVPPGDFHGTVHDSGAEAQTPGDAAPYWAEHLPVARAGVDGWWVDEGDRLPVYARLQRNQMYWEGPREIHPDSRPFALHRNGYAGLQRFGWLWSGDTSSTWAALKAQIMVGINVGLSGIPYWGSDTGGFLPTVEFTPELFVRWFQFSSFCPSFRGHGRAWKLRLPWGWDTGDPGPKEVEGAWTAGWPPAADLHRADVEVICRKFLDLRYQLIPYIYSMAAQTRDTGIPLMRALWLAYPNDARASLIDDSYLWGDSILVAPIYANGATERTVYLPDGAWWNFWTGEKLEGGREATAKAQLDSMPLFVKAGAIVPMGPVKQYASEQSDEPMVLKVYPGADGSMRWYDDDGVSFDYEHGEFLRVDCAWDDQRRMLTLRRDPSGTLGVGRKVRIEIASTGIKRTIALAGNISRVEL
ncbi:MAG TPA: TIM-barrel domain-containing protein [Terracidiphilus sp.]|nr:TIM-barrel domain-containing protein [Terracidiphilus sp.]